jgi:hypothetical protein
MAQVKIIVECQWCKTNFTPTTSQANHMKYERVQPCCSEACRRAAAAAKNCKPMPTHGPCQTCGKMFQSRKAKIFCSMKCYTTSDKFREMIREVHERLKAKPRKPPTMVEKTCMECGTGFSVLQRSKAKRFCTRLCYRRYMEKRFDRFIANPEEIALPQCYDEFLSQPVLHCLVKDCGWMGHALSNHMNYTHGIRARDFKKAAGFNLNSGIVSATMQEHLSGREYLGGVAVYTYPQCAGVRTSYKSLEGREHAQKAQALARYT